MSNNITVTTEITVKIHELDIKLTKQEAEELLNKLIYQLIPETDDTPEEVNNMLRKLYYR